MQNKYTCETCSSIKTIQVLEEYKFGKWWEFNDYHICKSCYIDYMKNCNWSLDGNLYQITIKPKPFLNVKTHVFSHEIMNKHADYIWNSFLNT